MSVCLSVCLSVCMYVCMYLCIYENASGDKIFHHLVIFLKYHFNKSSHLVIQSFFTLYRSRIMKKDLLQLSLPSEISTDS